jgi:TonB family protein
MAQGEGWSELDIVPVTTSPVPIKQVPPLYPNEAIRRSQEGWVLINFCIETDGSVSNPAVIDAGDYRGLFAKNALAAIKKWKFKQQLVDGLPQRFCNKEYMITFALGGEGGRREFGRKNDEIVKLIKANRLAEARTLIDSAFADELNLYEVDRLNLLEGVFYVAKRDDIGTIRALSRAALGGHLGREEYAFLYRNLFEAQFRRGLYVRALVTFGKLEKWERVRAGDPILASIDEIAGKRAAPEGFVVAAAIDSQGQGWESPHYVYRPLRHEIGIKNVMGSIDHLSLRCDGIEAETEYEPGWRARISREWGACSLFVFGAPETTFQIVEY